MTLQFPTLAEQALDQFRKATKTVALATIAKKMGADVERGGPTGSTLTYTFDDDTSIVVEGRGRNCKIRTELP